MQRHKHKQKLCGHKRQIHVCKYTSTKRNTYLNTRVHTHTHTQTHSHTYRHTNGTCTKIPQHTERINTHTLAHTATHQQKNKRTDINTNRANADINKYTHASTHILRCTHT